MRLYELFANTRGVINEAKPTGGTTSEEKYGSWRIRYTNKAKDGEFKATAFNARGEQLDIVTGKTQQEVISIIKKKIDDLGVNNGDLVGNWDRATVDFNVEFTVEYMQTFHPSGAAFWEEGGQTFLVLADPAYTDALGDHAFGTGDGQFQRIHNRVDSGGKTLVCISLSKGRVQKMKLKLGRYAVDEHHRDDDGNLFFRLIFEGEVYGSGDKQRLHTPGFTIAPSSSKK